jgi:hypothetical protein
MWPIAASTLVRCTTYACGVEIFSVCSPSTNDACVAINYNNLAFAKTVTPVPTPSLNDGVDLGVPFGIVSRTIEVDAVPDGLDRDLRVVAFSTNQLVVTAATPSPSPTPCSLSASAAGTRYEYLCDAFPVTSITISVTVAPTTISEVQVFVNADRTRVPYFDYGTSVAQF